MEEKPIQKPASRRYRVLLVEDQTAIRQMLAAVLAGTVDFEVIGEAEDVEEALRLTRKLEPDIIILDWLFPGGGGANFLRSMQAERLHSNVLVMSAGTEETAVREALTGGAKGYVEKTACLEELMAALRAVAVGGVFFGPVVAGVVEQLVRKTARPKVRPASVPRIPVIPTAPTQVAPVVADTGASPVEPAPAIGAKET